VAHELADAGALNSALRALEERKPVPANKLATCRARIEQELIRQLDQVAQLDASAKSADAQALLQKVDARYGGLAAPRSIQLAEKLGAQ
jgi:hypothetical protein